jgi:hypothetical protein
LIICAIGERLAHLKGETVKEGKLETAQQLAALVVVWEIGIPSGATMLSARMRMVLLLHASVDRVRYHGAATITVPFDGCGRRDIHSA